MWNKEEIDNTSKDAEFLSEHIPSRRKDEKDFISESTFYEIISYLPN